MSAPNFFIGNNSWFTFFDSENEILPNARCDGSAIQPNDTLLDTRSGTIRQYRVNSPPGFTGWQAAGVLGNSNGDAINFGEEVEFAVIDQQPTATAYPSYSWKCLSGTNVITKYSITMNNNELLFKEGDVTGPTIMTFQANGNVVFANNVTVSQITASNITASEYIFTAKASNAGPALLPAIGSVIFSSDSYFGWNPTDVKYYKLITGFRNAPTSSVLIGPNESTSPGNQTVAIGLRAGLTSQSNNAVAIGFAAGEVTQGADTVAIGQQAGYNNQSGGSVAMGYFSGHNSQGAVSVAIGLQAAENNQSLGCVAVGYAAAQNSQGNSAVAIGQESGNANQSSGAVAIGYRCGNASQGLSAVAIGNQAGAGNQSQRSVAIGDQAGQSTQGSASVAIGYLSGLTSQGAQSIAIGQSAGQTSQGNNSIAIGAFAGRTNQPANSIVINASGAELSGAVASACYINPIRGVAAGAGVGRVLYDAATTELYYSTT